MDYTGQEFSGKRGVEGLGCLQLLREAPKISPKVVIAENVPQHVVLEACAGRQCGLLRAFLMTVNAADMSVV
jgi:hypothetical protein